MSPKLAVVTVTYSPGEHLENFLSTLAVATTEKPQVIMADNGSTDGAPEAADAKYEHVRLLRTGGNIGYGGAINRAVAEIDSSIEFVVISNPDVQWAPGSLDELVAAANRWPRAGALGPKVLEPDGSVYPSARTVPDITSGVGHAVARYRMAEEPVDCSLPSGERGRHRACSGVAFRVVPAGATRRLRHHLRFRLSLLHVHGGRGLR